MNYKQIKNPARSVAAYTRLQTNQAHSIVDQLAMIEELTERLVFRVVGVYADEDKIGSTPEGNLKDGDPV
jgi:hypothetical protein